MLHLESNYKETGGSYFSELSSHQQEWICARQEDNTYMAENPSVSLFVDSKEMQKNDGEVHSSTSGYPGTGLTSGRPSRSAPACLGLSGVGQCVLASA